MQFKHPELLYALFLLLIPIIIHLFQLRRFQKEAFTNVAFLKNVTLQTRKSSKIKKWLTLLTRMLLLACIIIAFAQPFTSKTNQFKLENEIVIYLDNSFSMQAKGEQGELLKRAVQDIISNVPEDESFTLLTNNNTFRNTTIKAINNELLQLDYAPSQLSYDAALLKSNTFFKKNNNAKKQLVFISDFQYKQEVFRPKLDSLVTLNLVQVQPVSAANIALDSLYASKTNATTIELTVKVTSSNANIENQPISLYNNDKLIAKTAITANDEGTAVFTVPSNEVINGRISIEDTYLQFDNSLYFNINATEKINVLVINGADDTFLKRIYTANEFNYSTASLKQLDYNGIDRQNLIILNELADIPNSLSDALSTFTNNGGYLLIIPTDEISVSSYNNLTQNYSCNFDTLNQNVKRVTTINYTHPLYNDGVFEKRVKNFQYPKVNSYYAVSSNNQSNILSFEDGKSFLSQHKNAFIFTSALNKENSNFQNSPLIVPTLYNIGKQSLRLANLYYTIGITNTFDVNETLQQDHVLTLSNTNIDMIPQQQYFNSKVTITTNESPDMAGIYNIKNKEQTINNVSYNYNREESILRYLDLSSLENLEVSQSVSELFNNIKSDTKINELWKWFVIFALVFLIIEMLILKYFK